MKMVQFNKRILNLFVKKTNVSIISLSLLGILGVVIYFNSFSNSFHFDDLSFILGNNAIRKITDLEAIWHYWPTRFFGFLSFAINYQVGRFAVFGYHLFNLVLHILTAILVFIFTILTFSTPVMAGKEISKHKGIIAFFAAAIFLSHPVQTQAINYIFQRVTVLATFFYLVSLCLYVKTMFLIKRKSPLVIFCYGLSLAVALMGMFTKEISFTLPVMILFYDFCFLRTNHRWQFKYTIPFLIMLPIIPLAMFFLKPVTFIDVQRFLVSSFLDLTLNFLTQCRVVVTYLRLLVLPFYQNLDYDYPLAKVLWDAPAVVSFCFLTIVFFLAIRLFSKFRLLTFSIFWFFIALAVESTIIPLSDVINEHRLYLSMVGASIFIVSALYYLLGGKRIRLTVVVLLFVVFFCSWLSYNRNKIWKDEFTLWNDVVHKSPKKARPYNSRGGYFLSLGEYEKARSDFMNAINISNRYPFSTVNKYYYLNLGNSLRALGRSAEAITVFEKLIREEQAYFDLVKVNHPASNQDGMITANRMAIEADAYFNLANINDALGEKDKAIALYLRAIEIYPKNVNAYFYLGVLYANLNRKEEAMVELFKAIEIDPTYSLAYMQLAQIYRGLGRKEELVLLYKKAITNNLDFFDAYYYVGTLFTDTQKDKDAISLYKMAIEINPKSKEACVSLGSSYCAIGRNKEAITWLNKALKLDPNLAVAYNNLAVAYYYEKKYGLAAKNCDKAIELGYQVSPKLLDMLKPGSK